MASRRETHSPACCSSPPRESCAVAVPLQSLLVQALYTKPRATRGLLYKCTRRLFARRSCMEWTRRSTRNGHLYGMHVSDSDEAHSSNPCLPLNLIPQMHGTVTDSDGQSEADSDAPPAAGPDSVPERGRRLGLGCGRALLLACNPGFKRIADASTLTRTMTGAFLDKTSPACFAVTAAARVRRGRRSSGPLTAAVVRAGPSGAGLGAWRAGSTVGPGRAGVDPNSRYATTVVPHGPSGTAVCGSRAGRFRQPG